MKARCLRRTRAPDGIGVFDIAANKMLRKVPGGSDPEQFAVGRDGLLYVSNEDAAGLSFVDPGERRCAGDGADGSRARRCDADAGRASSCM